HQTQHGHRGGVPAMRFPDEFDQRRNVAQCREPFVYRWPLILGTRRPKCEMHCHSTIELVRAALRGRPSTGRSYTIREGRPRRAALTSSRNLFRILKLAQQLFAKVSRGNRALLDEEKVKRLRRESIAQEFRRFFAQRVNLILTETISDRLGRPLRISEDRALGGFATRRLVIFQTGAAARAWKKIDHL